MKVNYKYFLLLVIPFCNTLSSLGQNFGQKKNALIDRVEPSFWWVNMKNTSLQLLVYGENIQNLQPEIQYPGVQITKIHKAKSPNYLFLDLQLDKNTKAGSFKIKFKEGKKIKASYAYELKERRANSSDRIGFNTSDAIYLITPDRFANANPKNDYVKGYPDTMDRKALGKRHGGDIQGIKNSLDYIADLGFTAIWSTPLLENKMKSYSYHGYAITDFYNNDPRFGSNEEYLDLVETAHQKGIKMIFDVVLNHCGLDHWWKNDLPFDNWYNFQNNYTNTNHLKPSLLDPYSAEIDKKVFHDGWFVETMPDLNQNNPFMANYLIQNTIWWIEYANLDGFRVDTYSYPDLKFMQRWSCAIMNEYPNFNIVAEEWNNNPATVAYHQRGKVNADGSEYCLPSIVDFPIQDRMIKSLNKSQQASWQASLNGLYEGMALDYQYPDPNNLVVMSDNHDMDRIYKSLGHDIDNLKNALTFIFTTRGIPQIYYGTEVLLANTKDGDHGDIRMDFPGGWAKDKSNAFTRDGLTKDQKEVQAWVKKVLQWRKNSKVIQTGKFLHFAPLAQEDVYTYFRYNDQQKVMVVISNNDKEVKIDPSRFEEILSQNSSGRNLFNDRIYSFDQKITIPPKGRLVLTISNNTP